MASDGRAEALRDHVGMLTFMATIAAGVLGIAGVLVGERLGSRSQRDHWLRDAQLRACARLTDELHVVYVQLAGYRRGTRGELDWAPFNQALTAVSLICTSNVIEAAYDLDAAVWRAHRAARNGVDDSPWLDVLDVIEVRRRDFIDKARRQLAPRATTPTVLSGRPHRNDPMWSDDRPGTSRNDPSS
jgi:hypothetical protein